MTFFPHAALAYTLPTGDGTNAQALVTNGSGVVDFADLAGVVNIGASDVPGVATATASNAYGDLQSSFGPSVTLTTGTSVILWFNALAFKSSPFNTGWISIDVSGATTVAASDANSATFFHATTNLWGNMYRVLAMTGLTAGSNTFTVKYKNDGGFGAWTFQQRTLVVLAVI